MYSILVSWWLLGILFKVSSGHDVKVNINVIDTTTTEVGNSNSSSKIPIIVDILNPNQNIYQPASSGGSTKSSENPVDKLSSEDSNEDPYRKFLTNAGLLEEEKNNRKKKTDVSVTIYHHQAIHDPVANYGSGKPWNLYANGYGFNYGFDLDGKYSRHKGYQFEKALGREFCKQTKNCIPPSKLHQSTPLQDHIFNLLSVNNVPVKEFYREKPNVTVKVVDDEQLEVKNAQLFDDRILFTGNVYMPKVMPRWKPFQGSPKWSPQLDSEPEPSINGIDDSLDDLWNTNVYMPGRKPRKLQREPPAAKLSDLNFVHSNVFLKNNLHNHKWNFVPKPTAAPRTWMDHLRDLRNLELSSNQAVPPYQFSPHTGNWFFPPDRSVDLVYRD